MSACTCPCPECGSPSDYAELAKAARVLQADLDAAQNEIERLLSEIAALRIERDNLQDSLDAWDTIHGQRAT